MRIRNIILLLGWGVLTTIGTPGMVAQSAVAFTVADRLYADASIPPAVTSSVSSTTKVPTNSIATSDKLEIIGNRYVSERLIRRYLRGYAVGNLKTAKLNSITRDLLSSGMFETVKAEDRGGHLVLTVKENPIIGEIVFAQDGKKKLMEDLKKYLSNKEHGFLDKAKIYSDVQILSEYYSQLGFLQARIEPKYEEMPVENQVRLVFDIKRGKKMKIREIRFIGNKHFDAKTLRDRLVSTVARFYAFTRDRKLYNQERLAQDQERLKDFYLANGYADFNVEVSAVDIDRRRNSVALLFKLYEGPVYRFAGSKITNHISYLKADMFKELIQYKDGQIYNQDHVNSSITAFNNFLEKNGYLFVNISTKVDKDATGRGLIIEYIINEAPRAYINRINILGNTRTRDYVIRRELSFSEGDAYNNDKMSTSRRNVINLGYFSNVVFTPAPSDRPDLADINITVEEQKTGSLNFGIGYSNVDGANVTVSLKENNLFGTGNAGGISFMYADRSVSGSLSFDKPYFLGSNVTLGNSLYYNSFLDYKNISYDSENWGFGSNISYRLLRNLYHTVAYNFNYQRIFNIDSDASYSIKEASGTQLKSSIQNTLFYEGRDNRYNPSKGGYVRLKHTFYGMGGNRQYMAYEGEAAVYKRLIKDKDFVLKLMVEGGALQPIMGDYIKSIDNFRFGGNNFRGFKYNGIGPIDLLSGDHLGGTRYYKGTIELKFPNGLPRDANIITSAFIEAGTVTGLDKHNPYYDRRFIIDDAKIRATAGVSVVWNSPIGMMRFDFSQTLKKEDYDSSENFRFSIGSSF